jgi:hypothetical protein
MENAKILDKIRGWQVPSEKRTKALADAEPTMAEAIEETNGFVYKDWADSQIFNEARSYAVYGQVWDQKITDLCEQLVESLRGQADKTSNMGVGEVNEKYSFLQSLVPTSMTKAFRKLQVLLANPAKAGVTRHQEEGRVDRKSVHRALHGAKNVHKRNWRKKEITTAILIIIDGSGSMSGLKWMASTQLAMGLVSVLNKAKALFAIASFRDCSDCETREVKSQIKEAQKSPVHKVKGSKVYGHVQEYRGMTTLAVGKTFDRKLSACKKGMLTMLSSPNSGTPDFDAYQGGIRYLDEVKADRKILITIADGCGGGCKRSMTKLANRMGIQTMGFGVMGARAYKGEYNSFTLIRDPADLTAKVVADMVKVLGNGPKQTKEWA